MKKIAILGCENSHANHFIKFIKEKEEFSDVEVFGVYSDDREAAEKLSADLGVPVMDNYDDAVGKVDGIIVTARHGNNHYKYAKPYIDCGIPMFIDKPITISESDVTEFMSLLKEKGVRVSGGSSLKQDVWVQKLKQDRLEGKDGKTLGGYVRAPYSAENAYGGFYFYAQHLVEMVCEIFGRFPISVTAKKNGSQINVLFHYEEYDCVGLFANESYLYFVSRMSDNGTSSYEIPNSHEWYYAEFKEFHGLLNGDAQPESYEAFASPVFILNAIERSLNSGKEEKVGKLSF